MALVKVKAKYQVTLPTTVRQRVDVAVGDVLEAKVEKGKITLSPKAVVPRDEYTPAQRRVIDAGLTEALEDVKKGRVYGPFNTAQEMIASLRRESQKLSSRKKSRHARR